MPDKSLARAELFETAVDIARPHRRRGRRSASLLALEELSGHIAEVSECLGVLLRCIGICRRTLHVHLTLKVPTHIDPTLGTQQTLCPKVRSGGCGKGGRPDRAFNLYTGCRFPSENYLST